MIMVRSESEAAEPRTRVAPQDGLVTWVTRYFVRDVGDLTATAFIVDQEPHTSGGAHFHAADQFQVVVGGQGQYGKTTVQPYSVHFAAAFSPYGPITTGDRNLKWFTLRNGRDPGGIKWMPASREQLRASGRRPRVVYGNPDIPLQADGLGAWRYTLAAGEHIVGQAPSTGRGQFWIVLDGAGTLSGTHFEHKDALLFAAPDEPAVSVQAGPGGFDVLALQFPAPAN